MAELRDPFVSIIIPAFNEEALISQCLTAINKLDYPRSKFEIIVVDNGSEDATLAIAKQSSDKVLSLPEGNVGAVRNYGASIAKGDVLAFTDADCVPPENWLTIGTSILREYGNSVCGGSCLPPENANPIEKYWLLENGKKARTQKDLLGSSIFIRKDDFNKVSGFNVDITSGEDSALSQNLRTKGFNIIIKHELSVVHLGNAQTRMAFLHRQIWHSENYFRAPLTSFKDKTFLLVLTFIILVLLSVAHVHRPDKLLLLVTFAAIIPAIFSIKRIKRSGYNVTRATELFKIYEIDALYVVGRALGLIKSFWRSLTPAFKSMNKQS